MDEFNAIWKTYLLVPLLERSQGESSGLSRCIFTIANIPQYAVYCKEGHNQGSGIECLPGGAPSSGGHHIRHFLRGGCPWLPRLARCIMEGPNKGMQVRIAGKMQIRRDVRGENLDKSGQSQLHDHLLGDNVA